MKITYKFDADYLYDQFKTKKLEKKFTEKYEDYEFEYEIDDEEAKEELIVIYCKILEIDVGRSGDVQDFLEYLSFRSNDEVFDWDKFLEDGIPSLKKYYNSDAMKWFLQRIKKEEKES